MLYGLTYIFPRVKRFNDNLEPSGATGLLVEFFGESLWKSKEVLVYWGTQDGIQHFLKEDLYMLHINLERIPYASGEGVPGLDPGDLQSTAVTTQPKISVATNGGRKESSKWWGRLLRSSGSSSNGRESL